MNKVESIEIKPDKNQNDMKVVTFEGVEKKVYVNSKYDSNYNDVEVGAEFELEQDGNFLKIKSDKPKGSGKEAGMTRVMEKKQEGIAHSMDKKEEAIKLASTARMATDMVVAFKINYESLNEEALQEKWMYWRAYFYVRWSDVDVELVKPF